MDGSEVLLQISGTALHGWRRTTRNESLSVDAYTCSWVLKAVPDTLIPRLLFSVFEFHGALY
jgi:hypothetical protein